MTIRRFLARMVALLACAVVWAGSDPVWAGDDPDAPGLLDRDNLSGNWGGLRAGLRDAGVALVITETTEAFAIGGGQGRGATVDGRLEGDLDADLEKILGVRDMVLHANAYQIHGRGPSGNYLGGNLMTVSNIEAERSMRLFDLWVQNGFFDAALSFRIGQIAADDEFLTSRYAAGLINATFGWPAIMGNDLPGGVPAYPLATPGLRVKGALTSAFSVQAAIFNGDPTTGPAQQDPEASNASGTAFIVDRHAFAIVEADYAPLPDGAAAPVSAYKIGAWFHSGPFADPDGAMHRGNFGVYATVDQSLYRQSDNPELGLGAFLRIAGAPGDRNVVSFYLDAGLAYRGAIAGRDDDLMSLGVACAEIGSHARAYDSSLGRLGFTAPSRDREVAVELTYQIAMAAWWSVQPDIQYVLHPSQGVLNPAPGSIPRGRDAFVAGLRTSIGF